MKTNKPLETVLIIKTLPKELLNEMLTQNINSISDFPFLFRFAAQEGPFSDSLDDEIVKKHILNCLPDNLARLIDFYKSPAFIDRLKAVYRYWKEDYRKSGKLQLDEFCVGTGAIYAISINEISADINNFKNLHVLSLAGGEIKNIPISPFIGLNITHLYLNNNKITSLPEDLFKNGNLSALMNLDLDYNELTTLPDSFASLKNISIINLRHNSFESVPYQFISLPSLTNVDLRENNILNFPEWIDSINVQILV